MKKRWLVMITSLMMAVICCFSFAACNGGEKKEDPNETVKTVANAIKMMYAETNTGSQGYSLAGRWRVDDGVYCDITWTATAKTEGIDIAEYVTIGERASGTYEVPVTVQQGSVDITYTLTGSFTIDGVQGSTSFDKTIPALKTAANDGTAEHPFTVSDVFIIAETLSNGGFYQKDGKNTRVYIKGIVVDPGSFQAASGSYPDELAYVKIADEADDTDNAVSIAYIVFNDYFKNPGDKTDPLSKGDTIVVYAFIERFNDKPSIYYAKEDPDGENLYPEITNWEKAPKTDAQLAEEAADAVSIGRTLYVQAKEFDLPAKQGDATLTWAVKGTSDLVEVTSAGKLNVKSLPTTDTEVTLTVTATVNQATKDKDVKITVGPAPVPVHAGTAEDPYTVADVLALGKLFYNESYLGSDGKAVEIYVKGFVTDAGKIYAPKNSDDFYMSTVYIGDEKGALDKKTDLQLYTVAYGEALPAPETKPTAATISAGDEVVVKGYLKDYKGTKEFDKDGDRYPVFTEYKAVEVEAPALDAGDYTETLDFTSGFATYAADWSGYGSRNVLLSTVGAKDLAGTVVLSNATKQAATITDMPTMAAQDTAPCYVTVNVANANITSVKFTLKMWTEKKTFSKIVIETTTDGTTWTPVESTAVNKTDADFPIVDTGDNANNVFELTGITADVKAVRLSIQTTSTKNTQVGLASVEIKANVPAAAATALTSKDA